ncbi:sensor histidine kinase [Halobacillus karajensis]|uniref:Sensor histidine kinase n=1 Tax=Halobacillus karajensis TaxID=195088 RepID=A0A024P5J2_9BACI|nr:sensor histidine kinase [Halobacillus karajensis]CDQ18691.1 Sensor histidine kinase LiaS [Halobacillus karajensis]CDQ23237.1 Sensor histidine kinase LiaS [Halobacillus karajensis]CDQ26719.1 Sensor histidine kinase LiaS [Halobacillus karajensis]
MMNVWQRQVLSGTLTFFGFTILILTITFYAFPFHSWEDLWDREVLDMPYIFFVILMALSFGFVTGVIQGWFWRRQLYTIEHCLFELTKGNERVREEVDLKEMKQIEDAINELEDKMTKQTELAQRMVTERAEEREKSLQEVVVQERNRLARELHDSVSQQLFAASMMMSAINETDTDDLASRKKQMKMVERMIHQSQLEMRALLLHLRPIALKDKSLSEGAEELLYELTQKVPMDIHWSVETLSLEKGIEDQLFRILQEAVSNTLRHAKASSLNVMLIERDHSIILRIVDDGDGFDVEEKKASSYGLQNMQERAIEVGGTLNIVSVKEQGTRLEVKIPHWKREAGDND